MTIKDIDYATIADQFDVRLDAGAATARLCVRLYDGVTESFELEHVATFTGAFDERAVRAQLRTLFCAEVADLIAVRSA